MPGSLKSLAGTKVTDAGVAKLKGLKTLRELNLSSTRVTDMGVAHLVSLTGLRGVGLGETQVSDQGLKLLAPLTHLESLNVGKQVTDQVAVHGVDWPRQSRIHRPPL